MIMAKKTSLKSIFVLLVTTTLVMHVHGLGHEILDGDIYVEYIGSVYEDSTCTRVMPEALANIQAIKWTFQQLRTISQEHPFKTLRIGTEM